MYSRIKKLISFLLKATALVLVSIGCFKLGSEALDGPMTPYKFVELLGVVATMAITGQAVYEPLDYEDSDTDGS